VVGQERAILVAGPRQACRAHSEPIIGDRYGCAVCGDPDIVLTPDTRTAKVWSRRNVPVVLYEYEDHVDVASGAMDTNKPTSPIPGRYSTRRGRSR
jgi:hypothetical protein